MKDSIYISTDKSKLDVQFIHDYLSNQSYWAKGRSKETVEYSIKNSLCFGVYEPSTNEQIGFARVVTDRVVFAWIMDVFIAEEYRGKGHSKILMNHIMNHPDIKDVNGFGLRTEDAHGLYQQFGFGPIERQETWMFKKNR